jgi:hypothetical protein
MQRRFQLPPGLHLMMGDVSSGSATVSMVRKVVCALGKSLLQRGHAGDISVRVADISNNRDIPCRFSPGKDRNLTTPTSSWLI